jgi:hypothetical protein
MFAMRRADSVERMANVLERLEEHEFEASPGTRFRVSFSAGLAEFPSEGRDLHSLYRLADEELYRAKQAGGRRIYSSATSPVARVQTDVAIVSSDVAVGAGLRHLLEMRGYAVELYYKPEVAIQEVAGGTSGMNARVVLLDEQCGSAAVDLVSRLRDESIEPQPTILLLAAAEGVPDPAFAGLERIVRPFKSSWMMQRLRRVLAR